MISIRNFLLSYRREKFQKISRVVAAKYRILEEIGETDGQV
jgi:hypothetical protein